MAPATAGIFDIISFLLCLFFFKAVLTSSPGFVESFQIYFEAPFLILSVMFHFLWSVIGCSALMSFTCE